MANQTKKELKIKYTKGRGRFDKLNSLFFFGSFWGVGCSVESPDMVLYGMASKIVGVLNDL